MILFNGQIISSNKNTSKNEIIKFEQLNIDLKNLRTGTIKQPKLQETSTLDLFQCMNASANNYTNSCKQNTKNEITTVLNRRIILPFYIPIISLICSFLIVRTQNRKNFFSNKYSVFILSFLVLLFAELIIRYTGLSKTVSILFFVTPIILTPIIYFFLTLKLTRESIK